MDLKTIESLTEYFQALFAQKKSDGMLKKQEMDRLRNCVRKRVAEDLRQRFAPANCHASLTMQDNRSRIVVERAMIGTLIMINATRAIVPTSAIVPHMQCCHVCMMTMVANMAPVMPAA